MPPCSPQKPLMAAVELMYVTGIDARDAERAELLPADFELIDRGHVGHRTARGEVRKNHALLGRGQHVGAFRHEVDAAEHDGLGRALRSGELRQLQRVADRVGELDHFVALVVMAENDQTIAERGFGGRDTDIELGLRQTEIALRQRLPLAQPRAFVVGQ